MSQFIDISVPEYVNSEELSGTAVCVCCLSQDSPMINLVTCKHNFFLDYIFKYKMESPNNYACVQCHAMLKNIDKFRRQIEDSIQVLNEQIPELKPTKMKSLQISQVEFTSSLDEIPEVSYKDDPDPGYDLEMDVKIEQDFSDQDIPLAEVKKQRNVRSKKIKKEKPSKKKSLQQSIDEKYSGKLATVILNDAEVMSERRDLSLEDKYLRLPYKCESCVVGFEFEMAWKSHMEKQHDKDGFTCELCKSVLSSASSLKEHNRRHYRRYECTVCGKRYRDEYSAVQHYNELHSEAGPILVEFQCAQCDFSTRSHRSLRYHRSKHKDSKDKCTICGNEFTNKSSLKIHMYTLHKQSSRVYKCEPCGKVYRGKSGLFTHMTTSHDSTDRRAYCVDCRTYYRTAHNLMHHLRTHSSHITEEQKRFGCDECGSRFISKSVLKSHIEWEHLEIRNNRCTKCSKEFRSRTTLKKHIEFVHEKKRPPRNKICDYCGQGFTTAAILRTHIRTHTGERPYRCATCNAAFAHASALYNHNRLLHNHNRRQ